MIMHAKHFAPLAVMALLAAVLMAPPAGAASGVGAQGDGPPGAGPPAGAAPAHSGVQGAPTGTRAFGDGFDVNGLDDHHASFDLGMPESVTIAGPDLEAFTDMALAGDFGPDGTLYAIQRDNSVVTIAPDGMRTTIDTVSPTTAVDGMALHPTTDVMYAASGNFFDGDSTLYTLDLVTGALTTIGTVAGFVIDGLTFDAAGTLYAMDQAGQWGTIDTTTATATVIGTLDYDEGDGNFEGLDTDEATGTMYISAENFSEGATLRIVDPATATTTVVGPLGDGDDQFPWLAIESAPMPPPPPSPPTCFGQAATIVGTSGDDVIDGTSGPDVIVGLGGDDIIRGLAGDDVICGNAGDDQLLGGQGNDQIAGGLDDDYLHGGIGDDLLNGNKGRDDLHGKEGADTLKGGDDIDHLYGDGGDDVLAGNNGDDRMFGGDGLDRFNGGPGADRLHANDGLAGERVDGGPDADTCTTDPGDVTISCP